ncbi:hypothetical protein ADUPG1_001603, partial [Aduncisulcus paluster]
MYVDYQDESSQEHEPAYTALTAAALKRINSGEIKALSLDDRRGDPDSIPPPLPPSASSHGGMSQISHRLGSLRTHGTSHESRISTGANNNNTTTSSSSPHSHPSQLLPNQEDDSHGHLAPHLVSNPLFTHVLDLERERQWLGESGKEGGKGRERQWETSRLKQRLSKHSDNK